METKKCNKCGLLKPFELFNKNKNKKNGLSHLCKECHSEYRRQHYLENKDKVTTQVYDYNSKHPELKTKRKENKLLNRPNKKAGRIFECACCVCNNIIFVSKKDIENGIKKFCSKNCRNKNNKSDYYYYLKSVNKRANDKKLDFNLTEDFIKDLLEKKQNNRCIITNSYIQIKKKKEETSLFETASLDRIDNTKGYTKDNVQWVMLAINYMRLDFSIEDLHKTLTLIKENYNVTKLNNTDTHWRD